MRTLICLALAFIYLTAAAQETSVKGSFAASVDDHATIYLNGVRIFHGDIGSTRSPEIALKVGDHVVVHLTNDGGPKRFLLVFASSDGNSIASFRATDFRVVPETGVTNFDDERYKRWTKPARKFPGNRGLDKEIKNYSDWVWGDLDRTIIACVVSRPMFSQRPK